MGTQQARLARLVPESPIHMSVLFPLGMEGHGMLFEELADRIAEQLVVSAEQGSWNHCCHLMAAWVCLTLGEQRPEIGRASCRERVWCPVVEGPLYNRQVMQ